jgi:hypothetical protein
VDDPLERDIDQLFRLPPAELVAARNALADRLRKAGDKAAAARVKALKRVAPVAWAINQVSFEQPALLDRARECSNALRDLQAQRGVDPRRLAEAVSHQRDAVQAVVEAALQAWRRAGVNEAGPQQRKLLTTIQAWLAGKGDEAPGRMTQELEASGFDAFAGMTLLAPAVVTALPVPASPPVADREALAREALARAAITRASSLLAEREQAAAAARDEVLARSRDQEGARNARDQAQAHVREAELRLSDLRAALGQREGALLHATTALAAAKRARDQADEAAAEARDRLAALSNTEPDA